MVSLFFIWIICFIEGHFSVRILVTLRWNLLFENLVSSGDYSKLCSIMEGITLLASLDLPRHSSLAKNWRLVGSCSLCTHVEHRHTILKKWCKIRCEVYFQSHLTKCTKFWNKYNEHHQIIPIIYWQNKVATFVIVNRYLDKIETKLKKTHTLAILLEIRQSEFIKTHIASLLLHCSNQLRSMDGKYPLGKTVHPARSGSFVNSKVLGQKQRLTEQTTHELISQDHLKPKSTSKLTQENN